MKKLILLLLFIPFFSFGQTFKERIVKNGNTVETVKNKDLKVIEVNTYNFSGKLIEKVLYDPDSGLKNGDFFSKTNSGSYNQGILTCKDCTFFLGSDRIKLNIKNGYVQGKVLVYTTVDITKRVEMSTKDKAYLIDIGASVLLADPYTTVKTGSEELLIIELNFKDGLFDGEQKYFDEGYPRLSKSSSFASNDIILNFKNSSLISLYSKKDSVSDRAKIIKVDDKYEFMDSLKSVSGNYSKGGVKNSRGMFSGNSAKTITETFFLTNYGDQYNYLNSLVNLFKREGIYTVQDVLNFKKEEIEKQQALENENKRKIVNEIAKPIVNKILKNTKLKEIPDLIVDQLYEKKEDIISGKISNIDFEQLKSNKVKFMIYFIDSLGNKLSFVKDKLVGPYLISIMTQNSITIEKNEEKLEQLLMKYRRNKKFVYILSENLKILYPSFFNKQNDKIIPMNIKNIRINIVTYLGETNVIVYFEGKSPLDNKSDNGWKITTVPIPNTNFKQNTWY